MLGGPRFRQLFFRGGLKRSFKRGGDFDGGHSGGGCRLNAQIGVFKDEAICWRDAEPRGGNEKGVGAGLLCT